MVTMRRDVAAMQDNCIFDRNQCDITEYDRFMQEKMKADNKSYYCSTDSFANPAETYAIIEGSGKIEATKPKDNYYAKNQSSAKNVASTYDEYMISQLNRKTPEKIMTKEEFIESKSSGFSKLKAKAKDGSKKRLSKTGKVFIGIYSVAVLIVGILFFLLI